VIACVLLPYFAAAVERRANPALIDKPVVILEKSRQVWAVSQEAAQAGVRLGMSLRQSQALCPQVRPLPTNLDRYQAAANELLDILADFSERVEPERNSHQATILYVGLEPLLPPDQVEAVQQIGQKILRNLRLEAALGLTSGKFPAYLAARSIGKNRYLVITPGQEADFLAPFAIEYLPLEAELARRLRLLGLDTLGQFARLPAGAVLAQFGQQGGQLHKLARGQDERPVSPYPPPPAEVVTRYLEGPVADRLVLEALCQLIAAELAIRLTAQGRLARVISLTLELEDGGRWQAHHILRQPAGSADRLGLNLSLLLQQVRITCGVEAVTVGLADLIPVRARQLDLFANQAQLEYEQRLDDLLPILIARYGTRFHEVMLTNQWERLPEKRFELRARR
jgi:nucleotidyltransferase/DNA polymerase involved in DNA repair